VITAALIQKTAFDHLAVGCVKTKMRSLPVKSALRLSTATNRKFFSSSMLRSEAESTLDNLQYYARKRQTNVSLKALMETGNGKYLDEARIGSNSLLDDASANEKILIQVINRSSIYLKLAVTIW
jgi:hypothetical protein